MSALLHTGSRPEGGATAYIALGSNLGDRAGHLRQACRALDVHPDLDVLASSPVYETPAMTMDPEEEQPPFLNAVLAVRSALEPEALLHVLHRLEAQAGRVRSRPWAPRTLDLDLLTYGGIVRSTEALTLPHPRLAERRFVLQPLADLAPNLGLPAPFDETPTALLARCPDDAPIRRVAPRIGAL